MKDEVALDESHMPLTAHLRELRKRLIRGVGAFFVGFLICYFYSEPIFLALQVPLQKVMPEGSTLVAISVAEGFLTNLRVGALAGFFLASPVFFYQLWQFVAPGLYPNEKKMVLPFVLSASTLFLFGAGFGYFVVFPYVFGFFIESLGAEIPAMFSIQEFLSFSSRMLLIFGLIFQLPVISFFLSKMGIVSWQKMQETRKYAVVVIFIVGALLTPPDPVSQTLIAVPLILLYQVGIWVARLASPREVKNSTDENQSLALEKSQKLDGPK